MTETLTCYYENNDEPTCPACNHYNAMLADHEAPSGTERDYRKCRDCGAKAYVVAAPSANPKECVSNYGSDHLWVWASRIVNLSSSGTREWVRCSRCERRAPANLVSK